MKENSVFDRIYRDYLERISALDSVSIKGRLGLTLKEGQLIVPFFGIPYRISREGIIDDQGNRPSHDVSVVLCKYLLMCPEEEPSEFAWVTYKDFKDAAPFVEGFTNNVEKAISQKFSGKLSLLRSACSALKGLPTELGISYDLCVRFEALPKIPLLPLFNDEDEEFPAQCSLLFERRAGKYLDMECLAILGMVLSRGLIRHSDKQNSENMEVCHEDMHMR
ncbi:MAG: DUF3786 domain-containing protein [Deltaproteobacteria bacterium]|nr:DUF3786 domain-containing protein [Deltaproteobacteria bacterium]